MRTTVQEKSPVVDDKLNVYFILIVLILRERAYLYYNIRRRVNLSLCRSVNFSVLTGHRADECVRVIILSKFARYYR